ncbi:MAG: hypothetical protein FJZ56_03035 [Chlamydiae bacterium]|nr:hypothetical protein [Chlamydiota bacterium]
MLHLKHLFLVFMAMPILAVEKQTMSPEMMAALTRGQDKTSNTPSSAISQVIIVNPQSIADDWKTAFSMLSSQAPGKTVFRLADGSELINVTSIEPLQGGYLTLVTINSNQGKLLQVIKTADIVSVKTQ